MRTSINLSTHDAARFPTLIGVEMEAGEPPLPAFRQLSPWILHGARGVRYGGREEELEEREAVASLCL